MTKDKPQKVRTFLISFLSLAAGLFFCAMPAAAQTAMVTNNFVAYPDSRSSYTDGLNLQYQCQIGETSDSNPSPNQKYYYRPGSTTAADKGMPYSGSVHDRSFYTSDDVSPYDDLPSTRRGSKDPWIKAALIEYDQPTSNFHNSTITSAAHYAYPNHCLTLCGEVSCSNPVRSVKMETGDAPMFERSGPFPIQTVLFEVFKYQKNVNPYSPDSTPPVRTIALYPAQENIKDATCKGVGAWKQLDTAKTKVEKSGSCCEPCFPTYYKGYCEDKCPFYGNKNDCEAVKVGDFYCEWNGSSCVHRSGFLCPSSGDKVFPWDCDDVETAPDTWAVRPDCYRRDPEGQRFKRDNLKGDEEVCNETCTDFSTGYSNGDADYKRCVAGETKLRFCAPWDGSYEIDGEFGKSNGQFGYRTTISTKWPGDGVSTS
ncbi:MAG: hypothetical protein LBL61_01225, partial [Elusimicrobiota bacterium]|nr:hypothetical protein [Elusimicrobiota bacterium]